jgi:hypothetical protein
MKFKQFNLSYMMGYIIDDLPVTYIKKLDNIINSDLTEKVNKLLAGRIKKEFNINIKDLENYLINAALHLDAALGGDIDDLELESAWVNFQEKYEYNPPHKHNGDYSFVIWHKIPFTNENESLIFPECSDNTCLNGQFGFLLSDNNAKKTFQECRAVYIPVDKTWEHKIIIFPSKLLHFVNPFYTSDNYRISISGNLYRK